MKILAGLIFSLFVGSLKGLLKLFVNPNPFGYAVYGDVGENLFAVTATCGTALENGSYKTHYVQTDDDDGLFVFGSIDKCGKNAAAVTPLTFTVKCEVLFVLIKNGGLAFAGSRAGLLDRALLLMEWLVWVAGLRWLYYYYLDMSLSKVVSENNIRKIGCVHEMHSYSRVVWRVARKYGAEGYTIQHAAISKGKRWYFTYAEERESGLVLPDVMYIFNTDVEETLRPWYGSARFILGCSYRYSAWKGVKARESSGGQYCLFTGALAGFDNKTLIIALRSLLGSGSLSLPIRIRLHPTAQIPYRWKQWLNKVISGGTVAVSKESTLREDLENAAVVVGMSTTVLEEALLLGCPVIQLINTDYLEFINIEGIQGVSRREFNRLSARDLEDISGSSVDFEKMRDRLGLEHPIVTYKRLFAEDAGQGSRDQIG